MTRHSRSANICAEVAGRNLWPAIGITYNRLFRSWVRSHAFALCSRRRIAAIASVWLPCCTHAWALAVANVCLVLLGACGTDAAFDGPEPADSSAPSDAGGAMSLDGGVLLPDGAILVDAALLSDGAILLADGALYGGDGVFVDATQPVACNSDEDCPEVACRQAKCQAKICAWSSKGESTWCRRAADCDVLGHCRDGVCIAPSGLCGTASGQCCSPCVTDVECDDHAECTTDICDPTTHACAFQLKAMCKKACVVDEECAYAAGHGAFACLAGWCQLKPASGPSTCQSPSDCDDQVQCTVDACVQTVTDVPGQCVHTTVLDQCGLQCSATGPDICHDGNPCTQDACAANGKCLSTWTTGCGPAACIGGQDCDDGNPCTNDSCILGGDDVQICEHKIAAAVIGCCAADGECDDGAACTTDVCVQNRCEHKPVIGALNCEVGCKGDAECFDGLPWTADTCVAAKCQHMTTACECAQDSDCHTGNLDWGGAVNWCLTPGCFECKCGFRERNCSDGDPCTADRCEVKSCAPNDLSHCGGGQCVHNLVAGCAEKICSQNAECEDGNACTTEWCNGTCRRNERSCDDGNPCTVDVCDPGSGSCQHDISGSLCPQ